MDDIESYIDDRCPTIWGPTSSRPQDVLYEATSQQRAQPRHDTVPRTLPATPQPVASLDDGRVKPIEGALLRKLFQATMDEKRKVEQKERAEQQMMQQHAADLTKALDEVVVSKGFYVPKPGSPSPKRGDRKGEEANGMSSGASAKEKARKKGKHKAKATTAAAAAKGDRGASPQGGSIHEDLEHDEQAQVALTSQEKHASTWKGKSKDQSHAEPNPKELKQEGKLSKKEKKRLRQAENERAKAAAEDGEALMSGGLPAQQSEKGAKRDGRGEVDKVQLETIEQKAVTPRSSSKSGTGHLQPTVESVASSSSSRHKSSSSHRHSNRPTSHDSTSLRADAVEKPASFVSWEEVGQGVVREDVVRVASRIASSKHSSKATLNHQFEGFDQGWEESQREVLASERHSSRRESRVSSRRSSKRHQEETHAQSHASHSRQSRRPHQSQIPLEEDRVSADPWLQDEPSKSISKASTSKARTPSLKSPLAETDPWAQDGVHKVGSKHKSSRHNSKARTHLTFEEVGEGWAQATPEAAMSRASAVSAHSRPQSFKENRTTSRVWSQPGSEKFIASKASTHRSAAGTFEEIGEGWQGQDGVELVARSRRTSIRSREVSDYAWKTNVLDEERHNVPVSEHKPEEARERWVEVDEPQSSRRSAQSTKHSHKTRKSDNHLEATRPTVFAGKGWISPHPLSRSPTEIASPPQSKIVLPSEAFPHGATMTYEQWQKVQEEGMRRNISPTESHMTINARRAQSRHRFAGWSAHSSDGHRFEEVIPEAEESVSGPASYRVPSMDSERSSGGLSSDERPPKGYSGQGHEHEPSWVGAWEEQHPPQSSERSGRHSRVQTLSHWSHEHSGSKQACDGSEAAGSGESRESSKPSSRHDSSHSAHQSSRHSSRHSKSQFGSRHSSERHADRSDRPSGSAHSQKPSIGWGRLSLGTARSRQSHQSGGRNSHRTSHHTSHHSLSAQSKSASDEWQDPRHSSAESHRTRHSSHRESNHDEERSVSDQSPDHAIAWRQGSKNSQNSRREDRHHASRHTSHRSQTSSESASAPHSSGSLSSSERVMEVMEEGQNIWSDVPQYDGTMSNREPVERSDVSGVPTSQLYWRRYGVNADEVESRVERWE